MSQKSPAFPEFKGDFTDVFLKAVKAYVGKYHLENEREFWEGRGFGIRIRRSGVITFFYRYHFGGKRKFRNLGIYGPSPGVSLKEARQKHAAEYSKVKSGIDPMTPPPEPPPTPEEPEVLTVASLKMKYLEHIKTILVPRSVKHHNNRLEMHLIPALGSYPVISIRRRNAIELIESIATKKPGAARNVLLAARAMFTYAVQRELIDHNPFSGVGIAVPQAAAKSSERVLTNEEIRILWKELTCGYGMAATRRILQLILLLGQRPGEVAAMKYENIDGDWWTIPKNETKIGLNPKIDDKKKFDHRVYLTPLAKELIGNGTDGYVFAPRGKPYTEESLSGHVRREVISSSGKIRKKKFYGFPEWTPHDLRRTLATQLADELDAPHEHIDAILGHLIPGVTGIYIRTRYDKKKQHWALAWEKRLLEIVNQSNEKDTLHLINENRRILNNDEISIVWQGLSMLSSDYSSRVMKLILVTVQEVSKCAALHRKEIVCEATGDWWQVEGSNKVYLTSTALQLIGDPEGHAFAPRQKPINIATLSYHILKQACFGLKKWTPEDLRHTAAMKIREMGAPAGIIDALEQGAPANPWELRHWLENWEKQLLEIIE